MRTAFSNMVLGMPAYGYTGKQAYQEAMMSDQEESATALSEPVGRERVIARELTQKAEDIEREMSRVAEHLRHSLKHALNAGKLLCEAKKLVGHGKWLGWFEAQRFAFSESSAQRYMRLSRRWSEIRDQLVESGKPSSLADLTLGDALALLSKPQQALAAVGGEVDEQGNASGLAIASSKPDLLKLGPHHVPSRLLEKAEQFFSEVDHRVLAPDMQAISQTWIYETLATAQSGEFEILLLVPNAVGEPWFSELRGQLQLVLGKAFAMDAKGNLTVFYLGNRRADFFAAFHAFGEIYLAYQPESAG
ncbi:MAG: DUF3102 domain-containing protein [Pirellulaceae bacterium]